MPLRASEVGRPGKLGGACVPGGWDCVAIAALALLQGRFALEDAAQRDLLAAGVVFVIALCALRAAPSVVWRLVSAATALTAMSWPRLVSPPAAVVGRPWDAIVAAAATTAIAGVVLAIRPPILNAALINRPVFLR